MFLHFFKNTSKYLVTKRFHYDHYGLPSRLGSKDTQKCSIANIFKRSIIQLDTVTVHLLVLSKRLT